VLIIRKDQFKSLNDAATAVFVDDMVHHLRGYAPVQSATLGSEGLLRYVRFGLMRASRYSWNLRGTVRFYLELMLMLGAGFDTDPQYPWIHKILHNSTASDQMIRACRLHEHLVQFAHAVLGQENQLQKTAIGRLRGFRAVAIDRIQSAMWRTQMGEVLHRLHPERAQYGGGDAVDGVIRRGRRDASRLRVEDATDVGAYTAAVFLLGHRFVRDPQYRWAAVPGPEGHSAVPSPFVAVLSENLAPA
jgi:hypothetical protein